MSPKSADSREGIDPGSDRRPTSESRPFVVRYFFVGMALLFFIITSLGFVPEMVMLRANHIGLHWFTHVHGAVMTGWLLLFLAQALLAAKGRLNYHRQLGVFSAGFGVVVWITMLSVTLSALIRYNPPEGDSQFDTMATSLASAVLFGLFFTGGVCTRRNPVVHKRLLLLAMLPVISAGVDRIVWLPGLQSAFFVRYLYLDALLIPLIAYDFFTLRRIQPIVWIGAGCLIFIQTTVVLAAGSPAWHRFAYHAIAPLVARLPEVTLTDAQSDPLLGDYGSKDWHMTVNRDGGKLYLQLPNQPKVEMTANSGTKLFLKATNWRLEFVKDAEGRVTKVINTHPDHTWEAARLKEPANR